MGHTQLLHAIRSVEICVARSPPICQFARYNMVCFQVVTHIRPDSGHSCSTLRLHSEGGTNNFKSVKISPRKQNDTTRRGAKSTPSLFDSEPQRLQSSRSTRPSNAAHMTMLTPMSLRAAIGSVGPENPDTNFTNRLRRGEWLAAATSLIPSACIDGRPADDETYAEQHSPRVAGASFGLWAPLLLTLGANAPSFEEFTTLLAESGLPIGGHCDQNFGPNSSGCGAADHAKEIFWLIAKNPDAIQDLTSAWGFDASAIDNDMITNAQSSSIPAGVELAATVETHVPLPMLKGPHAEQAAVVNLRQGTTAYGTPKQIFHVDAWTFRSVAETIYPDALVRYEAALAAFNAAALLFLCSSEMPYIEVK